MNHIYTLAANHPRDLLARLEAEQAHVARLAVSSQMWSRAATVIDETRKRLYDRTEALVHNAWHDEGATAFRTAAVESVSTMMTWHGLITSYGFPGGSVSARIDELVAQYPRNVDRVRLICEQYEAAKAQDDRTPVDQYLAQAAAVLGEHDRSAQAVTAVMRNITTFAVDWAGPRAAAEGRAPGSAPPGTPGNTTGAGGSPGDPAEAGNPDTAAEPESPRDPQHVEPGEQPNLSDALSAATSALQAAEGLLGGGSGVQVPDPISVPDVSGLGHAPEPYRYGVGTLPTLAGLDAGGAGGGGFGGAAGSVTGVGTTGPGNPVGTGDAPVPTAFARGAAGTAAAVGAMGASPPMMPPNTGAAGARQSPGGIKPGNSDRPAAQPRPRARRAGPMTPGVALTGRAGAGAPTPAARRGWDSDNDSLQVLDEHLWQVHPQEEETHGQDRRGPDRDGGDRAAAHPAPDAGLAGPGRRADQPTRAR
ncbi:hypothetical protein [Actinophytocola sp. KF-1]